jgi:hypothetical protein
MPTVTVATNLLSGRRTTQGRSVVMVGGELEGGMEGASAPRRGEAVWADRRSGSWRTLDDLESSPAWYM